MKALIELYTVVGESRYAKSLRFLGIPLWITREVDVRPKVEKRKKPVGFQNISDTSGIEIDEKEEDNGEETN